MREKIFATCQRVLPGWRELTVEDFTFDAPKGFSSFTTAVRAGGAASPPGIFYRRLAGKQNAILSFAAEREVFLALGRAGIAARCFHYDEEARLEELYEGRTLHASELAQPQTLRGIADQLYRLHQLRPSGLPTNDFFERLHVKWGALAKSVLEDRRHELPAEDQPLCDELTELYAPATRELVRRCLPEGRLVFCHNDTYHGNVMRLANGEIRLLDFEFSCLNHPAYDFSNLFAETVMKHGEPEPPHFCIVESEFGDDDLARLIGYYLDNASFADPAARAAEQERLLRAAKRTLPLSDYAYAMAAVTLALAPIQKIRFIPYARQRFGRFLRASEKRSP